VGLEGVGGDHHPGQVEWGQQRAKAGTSSGAPASWRWASTAGGVVHAGQQVRGAAVGACPAGAAQGLAVDGDGPPPAGCGSGTLPLAQPCADRSGQGVGVQAGKGAADGGLGGDGEVLGGVAAGAQRGPDRRGRVGGPFGDRGDRRAPASTAAAAMARMATSGWRRPRAARGSGTAAR
jgi:hypothetical protein